jgi:predicted O-methyltransferase YrrM
VDAARLALARAVVADNRLTNVEVLKRDMHATRLPPETFDLVYVRLDGARHAELLREVFALTRPGGVSAIQCVSWSAVSPPRSIAVWGRKPGPASPFKGGT